ncbi:MAG: ABC transporter permease [Bacteroidales bacterium]|nr:ABC transporter permease [Bacteroidales bacterium]
MTKKIISSRKNVLSLDLKKLFSYRALIYVFASRDLKVQYYQTFLGILWSMIQPLTGLLIFTFIFSYVIKVNPEELGGVPYPLFAFSGLICWYFFSSLMGQAGTSLMQSQYLIRKIYFPKLILPISKSLTCFAEFIISFLLLFFIMLIMGYYPGINILFLPVFILLNLITGLSVGIWLSALTIRYRDFYYIIPYLVNFGIWLTPVFYPATLIPERLKFLIYFNPMAGVISGFRWSLFGGAPPSVYYLFSFVIVIVIFITGLYYFRKMETKIADLV